MTKKQIIDRVKEIILKYANPTRIYLYGSQVNGEATQNSDIDIDNFVMYSFPVRYNKKVFYFGKSRKKKFLYHFICFLNKNRLSL